MKYKSNRHTTGYQSSQMQVFKPVYVTNWIGEQDNPRTTIQCSSPSRNPNQHVHPPRSTPFHSPYSQTKDLAQRSSPKGSLVHVCRLQPLHPPLLLTCVRCHCGGPPLWPFCDDFYLSWPETRVIMASAHSANIAALRKVWGHATLHVIGYPEPVRE